MSIIIHVGNDQPDAKIQANNDHQPGDGRDTAMAKRAAMYQNEDAISTDQPENSARRADADILRREIKTGDNAHYTRQQVNQQETQVTEQALDEQPQNKEIEHIQAHMQDTGV